MAERGSARAATAAPGQDAFNDDDTDWESQGSGDGDGFQGDGGEGGGDPEDAAFDPEFEQDGGDSEGDGEELGEEPARPQRAQNRIQSLANENARLKRDLDDFRGRLDRISQPAQPSGPAAPRGFGLPETDEQFNARIQLLPPDERMEQRAIRSEQKAELRAQLSEFKNAQTQDKIQWDASCQTNERRKRWGPEVERERDRLIRENGQYVNREIIYHWLLGKWMDSPAGEKRSSRQRQSAQQRVRSQETRPTSPRSDVDRGQRGRLTEAQSRARRLEGQQI